MVGSPAEHVEPAKSESLEINILQNNTDTILAQHSYAQPCISSSTANDTLKSIKEEMDVEHSAPNKDVFYDTYDGDDECVTIVISDEDDIMDDEIRMENVYIKPEPSVEETLNNLSCPLYIDGNHLELLSPMQPSPNSNFLSPCMSHKDPASPASTLLSDFGYESVESPLSDVTSSDFQDLWNESLSDLFPSLI